LCQDSSWQLLTERKTEFQEQFRKKTCLAYHHLLIWGACMGNKRERATTASTGQLETIVKNTTCSMAKLHSGHIFGQ